MCCRRPRRRFRALGEYQAPDWSPPYRNISSLLLQQASASSNDNYLTYLDEEGRISRWNYGEFHTAALRLAGAMHSEMHVEVGDRIATLSSNDPRIVLIYFAAWLIGAVVVPVNCSEDDDRTNYILNNALVKVLYIASDQIGRVSRDDRGKISPASGGVTPPEYLVEIDAPGGVFDSKMVSSRTLEPLPDVPPDSECLIVYTSGTTGAPKGVVLEQQNLIADAQSIAEWHSFGPNDRAMCVLPIHHVNGTVVTLVTPMFTGGSVVLTHRFHAGEFWQTLASERCTWVSVVPTVLAFLSERKQDLSGLGLTAFRHIICGAGPLTVEVAHRFERTFGVRKRSTWVWPFGNYLLLLFPADRPDSEGFRSLDVRMRFPIHRLSDFG